MIVTNIAGSQTLEFSPFNYDEITKVCTQISSVYWNGGYATMIISVDFNNGTISYVCNKSNDSLTAQINRIYGQKL